MCDTMPECGVKSETREIERMRGQGIELSLVDDAP